MTPLVGHEAPYAIRLTPDAVIQYLQQFAPVGELPRQQLLARYDAHWHGQQYKHHQVDWWGRNADVAETIAPLVNVPPGFEMPANEVNIVRDKRPTAPANTTSAIVRRYTRLLFSRSRKPQVTIADDPESDAFLEAVIQKARFWNTMKMARNKGGAMGSVAITVHLREGRFCYEVHNPRFLHVVWKDRRTWEPLGFLKMFTYGQPEPKFDKVEYVVVDANLYLTGRQQVGGSLDHHVMGQASTFMLANISPVPAAVPLPGLGVLGLDPALMVNISAGYISTRQVAHGSFPIPALAQLAGLRIYVQALAADAGSVYRLTPVRDFKIE